MCVEMVIPSLNGASQKWILVALGVVATIGVIGSVTSEDRSTEILAFCSLIAVSLLGLLQQIRTADRLTQTTKQVADALVASDQVASNKLNNLASVAKDTHTLVNSNMGVQLQLNMVMAQRISDMTKSKEDVAAALLAKKYYEDHVAKQKIVDERKEAKEEAEQ